MNLHRLNLGLKFSIAVTALIGVTMFGVATLIINYQKESLRQNTFENNLTMTMNLAHDAESPLLLFDPLRLDELVTTVREATACVYAVIADRDGMIVAHTDRARIGSSLVGELTPDSARTLTQGKEFIREFAHDNGGIKEFSVPIRIGTEMIGIAAIAYSLLSIDEVIEARLSDLRRYIYLITGIMMLAGIGGAVAVSGVLTRPLKRLKDKMLAVQQGNLSVEAENPGVVDCRGRLGCDRKDCPAYGKLRCWAIAGTFCHGTVQGAFAQKIGDCRKCVVYQESCGDEISELVEAFNQMVRDLRYNLNELDKANSEKARLERLSALGEMATTVAHETKNPLNSIRLAADYLKKNFSGEILTEFLTIIEQEVMRLNDITTNFLAFSKPSPLQFRACDLNSVVISTVDLIRQEATERNLEIVVQTDERVPQAPCDHARLKQALMNLLLNAMDASGPGNTITITTGGITGPKGAAVQITMRDTGTGMDAETLANILKPFYTTKTRGSGLGLAIVDRIVKEHRGSMTVDSAVGAGTTFTITLPAQEQANA